jgi:hypothetical protein
MTESEWVACTDPGPMMGLLQGSGKTCERLCRLFACACVRRVWPQFLDAACGRAVEAAEQFADEVAAVDALTAALAGMDFTRRLRGAPAAARAACWDVAFDAKAASRLNPAYGGGGSYEWGMASRAAGHARQAAVWHAAGRARRSGRPAREAMRASRYAESQAQADLLRCFCGDPFRQAPTVSPAWLTWNNSSILRLAEATYNERQLPAGTLDVARLAVLADALEEAGCADAGLLSHLRGPGPHVRGCAVIDALLGKS